MILADTSVWVRHFRTSDSALADALRGGQIVTHPFIIGELACGDLRDREHVLQLLHRLPTAAVATHAEALALIERRRLMGRGLGYVDVHLLASTLLTPSLALWTLDASLAAVAARLGIVTDI